MLDTSNQQETRYFNTYSTYKNIHFHRFHTYLQSAQQPQTNKSTIIQILTSFFTHQNQEHLSTKNNIQLDHSNYFSFRSRNGHTESSLQKEKQRYTPDNKSRKTTSANMFRSHCSQLMQRKVREVEKSRKVGERGKGQKKVRMEVSLREKRRDITTNRLGLKIK